MATDSLTSQARPVAATPFLLLLPVLAFCMPGFADVGVQPCGFDSLEATFEANDGPGNSYVIALNLRNTSPVACTVGTHPGAAGMPIAADGTVVKICYYCEEGAQKPSSNRITLAPGESAHEERSWVLPRKDTPNCYHPANMRWDQRYVLDNSYTLTSPSLLRPICSELWITDYLPGQFLSDTVPGSEPGSRLPSIQWSNEVNESYPRDHIPFRVRVEDPSGLLSRDENSCPRLFVRFREDTPPDVQSRFVRVDEIQNVACKIKGSGHFVMEFDASYALNRNNIEKDRKNGEFTFDVSSLVELKGRHLLTGTTPPLQLSMVNGNFIPRNWDSLTEGVGVSLTLDRNTFELGQQIPLHIAVENFSSSAALCTADPYWDPPGIRVELRDASDNPILPNDSSTAWSGHGSYHLFPVGLLYPIEITLKQMGYRIEHPGVYKAIAVWSAIKEQGCFGGIPLRLVGPAAVSDVTVKSPSVVFRVVEHSPPEATERVVEGPGH